MKNKLLNFTLVFRISFFFFLILNLWVWNVSLIPHVHSATEKIQIIQEVKIEGVKNFKKRIVRELIETRPRDFYSLPALREDIQSILSSDNFKSAEVETVQLPKGLRLIFKVIENPYIKRIDFTGNKQFRKGKLKGEIKLKVRSGYDAIQLEADIQSLMDYYAGKGYPDVKIEPFTKFNDIENQVSINFIIKEGKRVLIEKIQFDGVTEFSQRKMKRLIKTKRKKVYDSEKIQEDLERIKAFYKNNGYAKIQVEEPKIEFNQDRSKLTLIFPIQEGQRYTVGKFDFVGNTIYPDEKLLKYIELKPRKLFKQENLDITLASLRDLYLEKGYLYSRVEVKQIENLEEKRIDFEFQVIEGGVVYIDRIFIEGERKTKEKVFRRELLLRPGDPFSSSKLRRSQEKIFNLGFIDDVKPDIQPARTPDKADLVIEILEGKPGSLSAGAGFSSSDGLLGQIQLSHSNLFGLAQRLKLLWEFGSRKQNYELNWTDPWIFDRSVSLGFDVFNTERRRFFDANSTTDYTERRRGGAIRIGPRFSDIYTLLFTYRLNQIKNFDIRDEFLDEISLRDDLNSSFTTEIIRDTRDYHFDASKGSRNSLSVEIFGGPIFRGDTHLVKTLGRSSWFWTLFQIGNYPFVFSVNGRAGSAEEFDPSTDVELSERFFVGGADSVRGYKTRGEIGPNGGGKLFTVFNAEYKIPLYAERNRRILQLVFFADIGGSWNEVDEFRLKTGQSSDAIENARFLKSSVGFGLRITTPVFPIRLDWGYGLNHQDGEEPSEIHFTLGNLF